MSRAKNRLSKRVWKRKGVGRFVPNRGAQTSYIPSAESTTLPPTIMMAAMSRLFGRGRSR